MKMPKIIKILGMTFSFKEKYKYGESNVYFKYECGNNKTIEICQSLLHIKATLNESFFQYFSHKKLSLKEIRSVIEKFLINEVLDFPTHVLEKAIVNQKIKVLK